MFANRIKQPRTESPSKNNQRTVLYVQKKLLTMCLNAAGVRVVSTVLVPR